MAISKRGAQTTCPGLTVNQRDSRAEPRSRPGQAQIAWPSLPARPLTQPAEVRAPASPLLSPAAVANRVGVCVDTIYREIRAARLSASKVRGQLRISEEELGRYLKASEKPLRLYAGAVGRKGTP